MCFVLSCLLCFLIATGPPPSLGRDVHGVWIEKIGTADFAVNVYSIQAWKFSSDSRNSLDFRPPEALRLPQIAYKNKKFPDFLGFPRISLFSIPIPDEGGRRKRKGEYYNAITSIYF